MLFLTQQYIYFRSQCRQKKIYFHHAFVCLFVCLFVSRKRENYWTDLATQSHMTPRTTVGLWMVKDKNTARKKVSKLIFLKIPKTKNPQLFSLHLSNLILHVPKIDVLFEKCIWKNTWVCCKVQNLSLKLMKLKSNILFDYLHKL